MRDDDVNSLRDDDVNSLRDDDVNSLRDDDVNSLRDDDVNSLKEDDVNSLRDDDVNSFREVDVNSLRDDDVNPLSGEGENSGWIPADRNIFPFDRLPFELLVRIVEYAISREISSRQFSPCVSTRFKTAVDHARRSARDLRIYINSSMERTMGLASFGSCCLSLNRLIRNAGKSSGLSMNIRTLISATGWYFAWLIVFRISNDNPGWFTIKRVFWRKKK